MVLQRCWFIFFFLVRTNAKDVCLPLHLLSLIFLSSAAIVTKTRGWDFQKCSELAFCCFMKGLAFSSRAVKRVSTFTPLQELQVAQKQPRMTWSPHSESLVHSTLEGPEGVLQLHLDEGTWELTSTLCVQGVGFYSTLERCSCIYIEFSNILVNNFKKDRVCHRTAKKSALDSMTKKKLICLWKVTGNRTNIGWQVLWKAIWLCNCWKVHLPISHARRLSADGWVFLYPSWLISRTGANICLKELVNLIYKSFSYLVVLKKKRKYNITIFEFRTWRLGPGRHRSYCWLFKIFNSCKLYLFWSILIIAIL